MQQKEQPPKIYIAMACYDSVKINTMLSVTKLVKEFTKAGLEWQIETVKSPYVSKARNALTALFLRSKYDYLLFIDADVEFNPEAVIRMLVTKKDIILMIRMLLFFQETWLKFQKDLQD